MVVYIFAGDELSVGRWKMVVLKELGGGEYGEVYQVQNMTSGEIGALKTMTHKEEFLETAALVELKDSGYVPLYINGYSMGETHSALIMTMGAGDLQHLLEENGIGTFEKKTTLAILWHVVSALEFCGKKKFIHRDIKAANIVVKEDAVNQEKPIMLIDWGLSYPLHRPNLVACNPSFDKSLYCTPEMSKGTLASARDDVVMSIYMVLIQRGHYHFTDDKTSLAKREEFEIEPEKFVGEDLWISNVAKLVFAKPHDEIPEYKAILAVIEQAEPGFSPKDFKFELKEKEEGKKYLL